MPEFSGLNILWSLLSFLLVIALLVATLFFLKRINPSFGKGENKNIRLIESCDLGYRQKIVLFEVNGEKLLIGIGPNQISLLSKISTGQNVRKH